MHTWYILLTLALAIAISPAVSAQPMYLEDIESAMLADSTASTFADLIYIDAAGVPVRAELADSVVVILSSGAVTVLPRHSTISENVLIFSDHHNPQTFLLTRSANTEGGQINETPASISTGLNLYCESLDTIGHISLRDSNSTPNRDKAYAAHTAASGPPSPAASTASDPTFCVSIISDYGGSYCSNQTAQSCTSCCAQLGYDAYHSCAVPYVDSIYQECLFVNTPEFCHALRVAGLGFWSDLIVDAMLNCSSDCVVND